MNDRFERRPIQVQDLPRQVGRHYVEAGRDKDIVSHTKLSDENDGHSIVEIDFSNGTTDRWEWLPNPGGDQMHQFLWNLTAEAERLDDAA